MSGPETAKAQKPLLNGPQYLRLFADAGERGKNSTEQFVRHPVRAFRMWRGLGALPVLHASLTRSTAGQTVRRSLEIGGGLRRFLMRGVVYALPIPDDYDDFARGSSRKLMRNSASVSQRRGASHELVEDRDERVRLLRAADDFERNHPQARYRGAAPDNSELLAVPLWIVVRGEAGEPLVLSMITIDGEWALLRYFRLMQDSETASFARYLMMTVLVRQLIERGVRHLIADGSPLRVSSGLHYFMQRVGFEATRVRAAPALSGSAAPLNRSARRARTH